MRIRRGWSAVAACTLTLACADKAADRTAAGAMPAASHAGGSDATPSSDTSTAHTRGPAGSGVPPGFIGRTDDSTKSLAGVSYTSVGGGMWEVETGTHEQNLSHITYSPLDTAHGAYTVKTEIDQISGPLHPEAAGVFIGGRDLAGPNQSYVYFLVRANGQYSIKLRQGSKVSILVPFTASPECAEGGRGGTRELPHCRRRCRGFSPVPGQRAAGRGHRDQGDPDRRDCRNSHQSRLTPDGQTDRDQPVSPCWPRQNTGAGLWPVFSLPSSRY